MATAAVLTGADAWSRAMDLCVAAFADAYNGMLDAIAKRRGAVHESPAEEGELRAAGQGPGHVRSRPHAAVDHDLAIGGILNGFGERGVE